MAFQIGIGDVVMLSQLAWTISQAFTSGRKSAPAEFKEVQNQVDSLCHALDSLKLLSPQHDADAGNSITPILQNCRFTLEHLETLVNKYMVIDDQGDAGESPKKRWREGIRKNWKKVRWTSEGGDLARLQHNLGVHINSLNLVIAVLNGEKSQSIGHQVEDVHRMLREIYVWFTSNLKGQTMSFQKYSPGPQQKPLELIFSLHPENPETDDTAPTCDNASFNPEWLVTSNKPVFKCNCQLRRTVYGDIHDGYLAQYFLSPMSLIVRLNGDSKSWKIWLFSARTSRLTSLILRNINPSEELAEFENTVSELAVIAASPAIHRGMGSLMVSPSINPYTELPVISVLNMLCDTRRLYKCIGNVTLTTNGHSYSTSPIETVQLVHYRNLTGEEEWLFSETANVILNTNSDMRDTDLVKDGVSEFTLTVGNDTDITRAENAPHALISPTDCLSRNKDGRENMVKGVYSEIELLDGDSATYLVQQLRHLQEGLLLLKVQHIQRYEKLVFELGLGLLVVYDYHLPDATLKLAINLKTKDYRLLISNASKSICLSIEMSTKALQHTAGTSNLYLHIDNLCWVVENNLDGAHVYQQRSRSSLACADTHTQQLLTLMLQSVARGDHGNRYPIIEGDRSNQLTS
ncbi:hypothetical protein PISL3812_01482 [Talaromyces islandicus]|uniref:NACHT-NTPase and P-loop NTPases N-terminal domain-containing protein n=1 Tax=Talaromyces islandicus TaxID=28573 RepID=A0A0U1LM87_TALIS|nr:hypothetical protein PISL3812_01482 [Talaromyces islandicus]